jgi:predicted acetyltransferase
VVTRVFLLVPACEEKYRQSYLDAIEEGFWLGGLKRLSAEEIAAARLDPATFFNSMLNPPVMVTLPNGDLVERPPTTALWWVDETDFIGAVEIRHVLSSAMIAAYGGHMSVGIRPSRRNQGHYAAMRAESLKVAAKLGIERLMVTVRADNIAARKVIEASGAIFMDEIPIPYSKEPATLRRYINPLNPAN